MKHFCKKSEHFWNEAQSRRHSFNSLYTDICMAHVLKCIQRHDNMPRNHKGNAGSSAGGAAFGWRGRGPRRQTGSPGRRPGLGGREASRRPPAGGQPEQAGRGGAEGRLQNQRRKSQEGPWGVARLGRKGKERLCGPFFTLGDEARGAEGRKRRKRGRR